MPITNILPKTDNKKIPLMSKKEEELLNLLAKMFADMVSKPVKSELIKSKV